MTKKQKRELTWIGSGTFTVTLSATPELWSGSKRYETELNRMIRRALRIEIPIATAEDLAMYVT